MASLVLLRDTDNGNGTLGRIIVNNAVIFCETMERSWVAHPEYRAGTPFESCVPPGLYGLERVQSPKYGDTFALENAELGVFSHKDQIEQEGDRYACLIHAANWARELEGCIAPGDGRANVHTDEPMVTHSRKATGALLDLLRQEEINTLEIRYAE